MTLDPQGSAIREIRGAEIAMVFQEPMTSFSAMHTIGNQIMEVIMLHQRVTKRQARAEAIEMLERVGMPQPAQTIDSYSFNLSGRHAPARHDRDGAVVPATAAARRRAHHRG